MVWYGMVWCGMVWYGVVWYGYVRLEGRAVAIFHRRKIVCVCVFSESICVVYVQEVNM